MACFTTIGQGSVGLIERCGRFERVASPGCHFLVPCADNVKGPMSMRVQQLDVDIETKTSDDVFVKIIVSVQFQVMPDMVESAFYKLTDQSSQIRSYVYDVVRSTVPRLQLDNVFTSKDEIAQDVKLQLTKSMESFGFAILQTLVTDIAPDGRVKAAMNEINAASRLRVAAVQKAEADKIRVVKAAEADAESKFLAGQGIARQRQAIINGLRTSVKDFESAVDDISSKEVLELLLMTQYFDTLRDIGAHGKTSTVFIPHQPGAIGDIGSQIRNAFLQANATQSMER